MSCHNCQTQEECACKQQALHISQVCNPVDCSSDECIESFPARCIIYTGDDIICNNIILATNGDNVAQMIANLTAYFCEDTLIEDAVMCNDDEVIPAGTTVDDALPLIVAYFCNEIANISLTPGPQGPAGNDGTDGQDGTRILGSYVSQTGIGNGAGISVINTALAAVPGNTLANDGDEYEVDLYVEYQENDPVDLIVQLGAGQQWARTVQSAADEKRLYKILISRIDQNNQMWTITELSEDAANQRFISEVEILYTTKDLSTTENFIISLSNSGAAGANALVLHKAILKLNKS